MEEPTELPTTEQPFEDGKRAIARAREELLEAASRAKEDVATGTSSQRLKETLMETTESLKSKERRSGGRAETSRGAQERRSTGKRVRPIKLGKAFATVVEEKRSYKRGPVAGRRREVRRHDRIAGSRASGTGPETKSDGAGVAR